MTHTSTGQPEALRLAEYLMQDESLTNSCNDAAQELRRLHARVQELEAYQARVPLSDEQIESLLRSWPEDGIAFFDFARAIERAHGITQEKQG